MTATSFELRLLSPGSRRGALQRLVVVPLAHTLRAARLNRLFTVTLFLAAAVRLLTGLGFQSALWFYGDSFTYVASATDPHPDTGRPVGYSFILWALKPLHSLAVVTTLQHVAGLGIAILTYAVVRRYGVSARLATLAAAPVLFDAYQIQLEHMILGDVWFTLLLTAAVALMLWHPGQKPSVRVTALAGLLLGFAAVLRTIGLPIVALLILWMLLRRVGWRALAAAAVAAVLPVVTYMGWYASHHGQFAMSYATGPFLWARTSVFADCAKFDPPPNQQWLCPLGHPETRSSSDRKSVV